MPRLQNAVPKYRKHKASGQAVVTIAGTDHYLGKHGTKASRMLYDRLIGEWLAGGRQPPPDDLEAFSVGELIIRYWKYAKKFYRRADGTPTDTADNMRPALRELRLMYGDVPVDEFGPISLKAVQQRFVELGQARRYVNENVDRIKRMYRWGVSEELVEESTLRRLETVDGLRKGKTETHDNPPVPPVDDAIVDQTLPTLPPPVAAMVQVQRLTGARPGEVCLMRPGDIDRSGDVWIFIPERHKTEHHDKSRAIVIGPRAQKILAPYLDRDEAEHCFNPAEVFDGHLKRRRAARKTPLSCGNKPAKQKRRRKREPGDCYTNDSYRRVIHRACDMGGMGYIESNKARCMLSVLINTHLLMAAKEAGARRYFFASSACVYNAEKQRNADVVPLRESDAYPAMPEDGYGWEKLFGERLCRHFLEDFALETRVARFHNVYGPHGTWDGGREKAPAAICRKVAAAKASGDHRIEIWGDGRQTRSFTYIDDCVEGIHRIMNSEVREPINLGSSELTTVNGLVDVVESIAGVQLERSHRLDAPKGVNGRNSDNSLILERLGWAPSVPLRDGMKKTYHWIHSEFQKRQQQRVSAASA